MIVGFVGSMGSGKTLSLVREVYKYYQKGYTIYSNMNFSFPYEPLTIDKLEEFTNDEKPFYNCVIVLDEIHILLDSRRSMTRKNLMLSYFITQTRKQRVKMFYTTQRQSQIEKRLRENTDMVVFPESYELDYDIQRNDSIEKVRIVELMIVSDKGTMTDEFIGNRYYDYYDTEETINM